MEWASNNLPETLIVLGLVLLVIEIAVLGFATFVLSFVGIAAVISGTLIYVSIIPDTVTSALLSTGIITAIAASLLWKPLKNLQNKVDKNKAKGDLVGHCFILTEPVSPTLNPTYRYSGIAWKLISSEALTAGTKVEVTEADVGVFYIKVAAN